MKLLTVFSQSSSKRFPLIALAVVWTFGGVLLLFPTFVMVVQAFYGPNERMRTQASYALPIVLVFYIFAAAYLYLSIVNRGSLVFWAASLAFNGIATIYLGITEPQEGLVFPILAAAVSVYYLIWFLKPHRTTEVP